jgi:hypothetical protein
MKQTKQAIDKKKRNTQAMKQTKQPSDPTNKACK